MKLAILFVLCSVILAVTSDCPHCRPQHRPQYHPQTQYRPEYRPQPQSQYRPESPRDLRQRDPFGFNNPDITNLDMKAYFVDYVHAMNRARVDELRAKTPDQLVALAVDELLKRLQIQPEEEYLIRQHLKYFLSYQNRPVPQAPFIDFNKDLSKLSEADLRVYLIGYAHALTGVSENELNYMRAPELLNLILNGITKRHHENKNSDPYVTDLIRKHYDYFARLKKEE